MRKVPVVVLLVALLVGSGASASAIPSLPVTDLLADVFGAGEAPKSIDTAPSPAIDPGSARNEHSTQVQPTHSAPGPDAVPAALETPAAAHLPANDHAKGLVFDGLRPAQANGPCAGAFEIAKADGTALCTHGPDAAPPGLDVRAERSVPELAATTAAATTSGTTTTTAGVPCIGDGVSGNRVQAIYAVANDRTDRYGEIAALIPGWAATVDEVFAQSAAQVGGERHVRFVTNANCELNIARAVLSPTGDDNIMNTINELAAAGYNRADRKYLIWMDASIYCGIAQIFTDDRPGQDNLNNTREGFARVDQGCWGGTYSTEAHELVHSLGGVQPSAPHASANYHCTDEEDRMCYSDGVGVTLTYPCSIENARYLDCNHDDYYHPQPAAGSYLATHWNVANSSFLHVGSVGSPPPPPSNAPPVVSAVAPASVTLGTGAALDGTVSDDGMPGPYSVTWMLVSGPGTATFANAAAEDTTVSLSTAGDYVLKLMANDGELTSETSVTVTVAPPAPPPAPTPTTDTFVGAISRRAPVQIFQTTMADGPADAVLTFSTARTKKSGPPQLTLKLYDAAHTLIAAASGPSAVKLTLALTAGSYTWEVSGANTSFTLAVTHMKL